MSQKGFWLYCIIENRDPMDWDCLGIHGTSRVFPVIGGEFTAIVSEEPMKKYPLVRDYLMAHQKVNETVMQTHRVLPVRFCTMTESKEKIIEEVLIPKADEFRRKLSEIEGKNEYGLRVRWKDLDRAFREIGENNEKIREEKNLILSLPEEKRRAALIDIGHLVQEAIQEKNELMAQTLMDELAPFTVEAKQNNTLGDAMILNAAFLIENEKQKEFDRAVDSLDTKYGEQLQFKYIGPVPPFNFVEIVIRWKEEPGSRKQEAGSKRQEETSELYLGCHSERSEESR